MVDPPSRSLEGGPPFGPPGPSSFDESVLYLLAFSDRLFDLVPDGIAVLDDRLGVRAANGGFLELAGLGSIEAARGASLAAHPLLSARVDAGGASMSIADLLRDQLAAASNLATGPLRARDEIAGESFEVRLAPWDTDDARSRRVLLWIRREPEAAVPPAPPPAADTVPAALLEEKNDRYFALRAFTDKLLEVLPVGVCLLDPSLRLVYESAWMRRHVGRSTLAETPADRHLFALYPALRREDVQHAVGARQRGEVRDPLELTLNVEGEAERRVVVDVHAFLPDGSKSGILLVVRDAAPQAAPPALSGAGAATPAPSDAAADAATAALSASAALPAAGSPRILLVERDAPQRTALSDRLRLGGFDDLVLAASGTDALVRQDPSAFALVVLGFEPWDQEAVDFARHVAAEAPRVPVFVVSSAHARDVERFFGELPIRRVLERDGAPEELARAAREVLAMPEPPRSGVDAPPGVRTRTIILLGARESDVPVLRLLFRAPGISIRMLYDPDPDASGLALGRSLGIPALAGPLEMSLENPPDAVVLAREGLEEATERLGLGAIPRVTRDEIELFLVDPDAYLASEPSPPPRPEDAVPAAHPAASLEPPSGVHPAADTAPSAAPTSDAAEAAPASEPAPFGFQGLGGSAPLDPFAPAARVPAAPAGPSGFASSAFGRGEPGVRNEIETMIHALDLLLDFQKLANWMLDVALRLTHGASGSLMQLLDEKPVLAIVASRGLKDIAARHRRQRVGEGIAGRVAEDGEPLLLVGTVGDAHLKPMGVRPEIRSSVSVPLVVDTRVIGVLNLNSDPTGEPFDAKTLEAASSFGREVGGALARSLQLRRMRGRSFEQSMRAEISTIASSPGDLGAKLRQIADRLANVLAADSCTIYLLDRDRHFLDLAAASGVSAANTEAIRVPIGTGVVGWVAKSRRPLVLRNPEEEVDDPQPTNLAFPIRHQTDLLGVLTLEAAHPMATEEDRLALVDSIAGAVGALIGEARTAEDSTKMVTMLSALSELGLAFGAATHPRGLARLVAFTASTVLESDVSLVRLRRPDAAGSEELSDFEILASHGASVPLESEPLGQLEARLAARAIEIGEPCRDIDLPLAEAEGLLRGSNVSTAMAVPITTPTHEALGAVTVCRVLGAMGQESVYGDSEVEIAARLGDYAAAAARKFLQTSDRDDDGDEAGEFD